MSKIDTDKFVCSMIEHYRDLTNADPNITRTIFDDCLQDQNLKYQDGKIVEIWDSEKKELRKTDCHCTGIGNPKESTGVLKELDTIKFTNPCNVCTNRKGCATCENGKLRETDKEELINCLGTAPTGDPKAIRELLREFFETFYTLLSDENVAWSKAELLSRYKKYEEAIMSVARKQIASEIDINEMLKFYKGTFTSRRIYSEDVYKEGIEDTIKKIKGIDL